MHKRDVIDYFGGTQIAVARFLGVTKVAVFHWEDLIPELRARQLHEKTGGKLKFRPKLYERRRRKAVA